MNTPQLPGFDDLADLPGTIATAAHGQLARLRAAGQIGPDQDILVASILGLAQSMDRSAARGQSVALAHASKELREWYLLIPTPPAPDDPFMKVLREAAEA